MLMAIQDFKTGIVSNFLFLPLLLFIKLSIGLVLLFVFFVIIFQFITNYIGGADIKLFTIFMGIFDVNNLLIWLILALSIALIYSIIFRKQSIRMFPFFLMAYVMVLYQ